MFPLLIARYLPVLHREGSADDVASEAPLAELWQHPDDLASRELMYGRWGSERAPNAHAIYTFVERKQQGTNPGVTVEDPDGRDGT